MTGVIIFNYILLHINLIIIKINIMQIYSDATSYLIPLYIYVKFYQYNLLYESFLLRATIQYRTPPAYSGDARR